MNANCHTICMSFYQNMCIKIIIERRKIQKALEITLNYRVSLTHLVDEIVYTYTICYLFRQNTDILASRQTYLIWYQLINNSSPSNTNTKKKNNFIFRRE